jgi:hypothetical protein
VNPLQTPPPPPPPFTAPPPLYLLNPFQLSIKQYFFSTLFIYRIPLLYLYGIITI